MKNKVFKLDVGEMRRRLPGEPIIEVIESGSDTYIWIGNNADGDMGCFATFGGKEKLESLAREILRRVEHPKKGQR